MIGRSDRPLMDWGDELRRARVARCRSRRRMLHTGILIGLVGLTIALPPPPLLVWNASASVPIGLYAVRPGAHLQAGDMVVARLAQAARELAADRHYLPRGVPVLKRIAAMAGDEICARGRTLSIDGRPVALRRIVDAVGRAMPWWEGCQRLRDGEMFLLIVDVPSSFDGRYFGVTREQDVIGKAHLLWRR